MKSDYDAKRLDELLQLLLDDDLTGSDGDSLNSILRESQQARAHYWATLKLHSALIRHHPQVASGQITRGTWRGHSVRRLLPWQITTLAAAACILLGFVIFINPSRAMATLSGSTSAIWTDGTHPGDSALEPGNLLGLASGFVEVSYRSGVRVILEGPCRFEVTTASSMNVTHGRATVRVPRHIDVFHLDTPAGRITDLGTEFGIAVGSGVEGPVILAEVFDGEIEIPAEKTPRKRLHAGDSLAILGETGGTRLVSTLGDYHIDLGDFARSLPGASQRISAEGNLAFGKPVTSPAHYEKEHGNIFPADTLTDGRLNDSGSPGDWSFWLAPDGDPGVFTVDLQETVEIGRIDLQNTRNRTHGDRGMRDIAVLASGNGVDFHEIFRAELARVPGLSSPGVDFPFESFSFAPVTARFVRVIGLSHFRHPDRPEEHPSHGGGLNEIRVFAP